jgi:hypothetical protein
LESGNPAAGHTSEEDKGKIDIVERAVSADSKEEEGIAKNACTNSELSEKTGV